MDTIFAVSSGAPPAAIAILRLSGPQAFAAAEALAGALPRPRYAALRQLRDPVDGAVLDNALVLLFPGPNSATGEDVAEFHVHGGRAVVRAVETALSYLPGLRLAEAGEFTRRALTNGRIDLAEAEGLGDLLAAETESQRRAAIASAEGAVSRAVHGWAARLVRILAEVEAAIDFSDEGDVQAHGAHTGVRASIEELAVEIGQALANPPVERLKDGIRIVLAGPPNSGKSTLFNALAERDAAIVSPISGTTRDRIEAAIVRDGIAYLLMDTAGLAESSDDPIEKIGIERSRAAMEEADIVLWLGDEEPPGMALALHPRADLPERNAVPERRIGISAETGAGLPTVWKEIAARAATLLPRLDRLVLNRRQRDLAIEAHRALLDACHNHDEILVAEDLHRSARALDRITGTAGVEDMLDALFGQFCLGK